jgi:hypothetical protein
MAEFQDAEFQDAAKNEIMREIDLDAHKNARWSDCATFKAVVESAIDTYPAGEHSRSESKYDV